MRRTTENQGNSRTFADYFSPRAKGKDLTLQQRFSSHSTSFAKESPMKPSQVPNRLPHPAPRGTFPGLKAELYPTTPCQDQRHRRTCSTDKFIPAVDLNSSPLKRRRESEDYVDSAVNLGCENSCKAQTPKPTAGNSLRTSLVSVPSSRQSSFSEQSPKATDNHPWKESVHAQSTFSSSLRPTQCSYPSQSLVPCEQRNPPMGAKQAYVEHTENHTLRLIDVFSSSKQGEESLRKRQEEKNKSGELSSSFSHRVLQKDIGLSPPFHSGSHHSGHSQCSASILPVKTPDRGHQTEEKRKLSNFTLVPTSRPNSDSLRSTLKRSKTAHSRKPVTIPNDADDLFTPDPITYVVSPAHKSSKPNIDRGVVRPSTSVKSCSSSDESSPVATVTEMLCRKIQSAKVTGCPRTGEPNLSSQLSLFPTVTLTRVNLENLRPPRSKDSELKNDHITFSSRQKPTTHHSNNARACTRETAPAASRHSSTHPRVQSPLLERRASGERRQQVDEVDPVDVELDLDLSLALDMDLTQSSQSSEEEQLLSLQEMMERAAKSSDTPEKGAFSEPGTPGPRSCKSKTQAVPSYTKSGNYKNSLDQMLKEIDSNKRSKEIETQLLTACKEDLLRIAEYEEAEESREEGITTEHQEFLQRYSLMSSAIREVPPGEMVFKLEKFGQIFNQNTLQLRNCMLPPEGSAQKALLWSSHAQLRLHVISGLFQEAYAHHSPCPTQVTRFLFKMMSVHNERMLSENILQTLCDIACVAAYQIVKNGSHKFEVWVPSLADFTLVLMNMGASFVTLFPFENLQPPFSEGDLLEDIYFIAESPSSTEEQTMFPEHNCINVLKYLSYCTGLCPRAYSDHELLLLITVLGKVGLDTQLIFQATLELYSLLHKIVNNFRDWNAMMPRICLAFTDLTDDHHNMCLLVQMLPDSTRGKQLRRHLSLSMISKLLDGSCTYTPTGEEIQLSELRRFLPRMQPSTLLQNRLRTQREKEDMATLDQQSYYLCYSLLTLTNEASNFQIFPADQKKHMLNLCSELEMHVKCDIRESEKRLYRSKVKDLVARIYTKWQILLQKTRPLNGKLYDFWQPLSVDILTSIQQDQEVNSSEEEEEDEEKKIREEKEVKIVSNKDEDEEDVEPNRTGGDTEGLLHNMEMEAQVNQNHQTETGDIVS